MGGLLTALLTPAVLKTLAGLVVDKGADLFGQYMRKEISQAELEAKLVPVLVDGFTEVQRIHAESLDRTFATFLQAVVANRLVARVWAVVVLVELGVGAGARSAFRRSSPSPAGPIRPPATPF